MVDGMSRWISSSDICDGRPIFDPHIRSHMYIVHQMRTRCWCSTGSMSWDSGMLWFSPIVRPKRMALPISTYAECRRFR